VSEVPEPWLEVAGAPKRRVDLSLRNRPTGARKTIRSGPRSAP